MRTLFDHLRHQIQPSLDLRRNGLEQFALIAFRNLVFAQALGDILGMRHGGDAGGIHGLHFGDQTENIG